MFPQTLIENYYPQYRRLRPRFQLPQRVMVNVGDDLLKISEHIGHLFYDPTNPNYQQFPDGLESLVNCLEYDRTGLATLMARVIEVVGDAVEHDNPEATPEEMMVLLYEFGRKLHGIFRALGMYSGGQLLYTFHDWDNSNLVMALNHDQYECLTI